MKRLCPHPVLFPLPNSNFLLHPSEVAGWDNPCPSLSIPPPFLTSSFLLHTLKEVAGRNKIGRQIDQLIYELYGLTEKEIKIVEGTTNG